MARKSGRKLGAEEQELWGRVAETARPLRKRAVALPMELPESIAPPAKPKRVFEGRILRPEPVTAPPRHDLLRPLSDALRAAPVAMDMKQFQRMTRGKLEPEARIDLHGMTLAQAHAALNGFILRAHGSGLRLVLVITGKGKSVADDGPIPRRPGALKHDVPQWLRMAPLAGAVLELREAHARHGGSGAYYVYLRRGR